MSQTTKANPATEAAANILQYHSGRVTVGPLTITGYMDAAYPQVLVVVELENKIIGIGHLDGRSKIVPISYSFKGHVGGPLGGASAHGTLVLELGKKDVTYDVTVDYFDIVVRKQGILLNY